MKKSLLVTVGLVSLFGFNVTEEQRKLLEQTSLS